MAKQTIRKAMRQNEQEVLEHLRQRVREGKPVTHLTFVSMSWMKAIQRLQDAGLVQYIKDRKHFASGYYKAVKFARPITSAK